MESEVLKAAKKQFFDYEGSLFMMARDEVLEKYLNYHIPIELEIEWINDMFDDRYKKLDINNADSLIFMTSIISKHADSLFNRLYLVDYYITRNINKCLDLKSVQILVESILYTLHSLDKIDVKKEIRAFKKLKRKIQVRKIKLMIKKLQSHD